MALTPSTMLELGTSMPSFSLTDVTSGNTLSSQTLPEQPTLVMFICTHCPFVKHVETELAQLGRDYADNVTLIAIGSNDAEAYPDDAPDKLKAQAEAHRFTFPYLYDETQEVAKAFTAACTPDFFLFDSQHKLSYRGRLDGSRPNSDVAVTGQELRAALDAATANTPYSGEQLPSMGCNIKWKAGNAPAYLG